MSYRMAFLVELEPGAMKTKPSPFLLLQEVIFADTNGLDTTIAPIDSYLRPCHEPRRVTREIHDDALKKL
jgi:hypothetical protein